MIKKWRIRVLAAALLTVAVLAGMPLCGAADVGPCYSIEMSRMIPMRDGTELEAWIFKPSTLKTKAPTVLELAQYDIDGGRRNAFATFVKRGYVFVQVYVRGRGKSGGAKIENLGLQVGRDGHDVVEWIAAQPWRDGRVVMCGAEESPPTGRLTDETDYFRSATTRHVDGSNSFSQSRSFA
jgi:predicted acyl esterase